MAFINAGYFAPNPISGYCVPEQQAIAPYDPKLFLKDAMYAWWKPYKIRYTYDWFYNIGGTDTVYGKGSVIMEGGLQTMSEKVCPTTIYYTCAQELTIEYNDGRDKEQIFDAVYLSIDSLVTKYIQINEDESRSILYNPQLLLTIIPAHTEYEPFWETTNLETNSSGGSVDFFKLWKQPLYPMIEGYQVEIKLTVEEESQAK